MAKKKRAKFPSFTAKQKARAVMAVRSGKTPAAAAELVDTTAETVCNWVAQDEGFKNATEWRKAGHGVGKGRIQAQQKSSGQINLQNNLATGKPGKPGFQSGFTDEIKAAAVAKAATGTISQHAVAKEVGCSQSSLRDWIAKSEGRPVASSKRASRAHSPHKAGRPTIKPGSKGSRWSPEQKAVAVAAVVERGVRMEDAAEEAGCSANTVRDWIAKSQGFMNRNAAIAAGSHIAPGSASSGNGGLPTVALERKKYKKAMPLVVLTQACPHCNGPIEIAR